MLSFPMYEDFRDNFVDRGDTPALPRVSARIDSSGQARPIFSGLFARRTLAMNVGIPGKDAQTERVPGEIVSGTFFQVLGVGAAIGRDHAGRRSRARRQSGRSAELHIWRNRFGDPESSDRRSR
jgi:hypothetical protein